MNIKESDQKLSNKDAAKLLDMCNSFNINFEEAFEIKIASTQLTNEQVIEKCILAKYIKHNTIPATQSNDEQNNNIQDIKTRLLRDKNILDYMDNKYTLPQICKVIGISYNGYREYRRKHKDEIKTDCISNKEILAHLINEKYIKGAGLEKLCHYHDIDIEEIKRLKQFNFKYIGIKNDEVLVERFRIERLDNEQYISVDEIEAKINEIIGDKISLEDRKSALEECGITPGQLNNFLYANVGSTIQDLKNRYNNNTKQINEDSETKINIKQRCREENINYNKVLHQRRYHHKSVEEAIRIVKSEKQKELLQMKLNTAL